MAIVFFVYGVFTGTFIAQSDPRQSQRRSFVPVGGLVAAIILASQIRPPGNAVSIAALSFAMGVMNTTIARVRGRAVNIGFVASTLNRLADHVALAVERVPLSDAQGSWDPHTHRVLLLFGVWFSFLADALVSAAGRSRLGTNVLRAPLLMLLALAALNPSQLQSTDAATPD